MIIGVDASRANKIRKTGTEWYSFFLIQEFKKIAADHRFRLYTNDLLQTPLADLPPNFQEVRLSWPPKRLWTQLRLSFELLIHRPDVLFVPAHVAPFLTPCKTVVTVHDVGFKRMPWLYGLLERWYHELTLAAAVRFADSIICPSHFTKREILHYYPEAGSKVAVVHHGVYPPSSSDFSTERDSGEPFFLFIGRLEEKKNILGILKAFKKLVDSGSDARLVLVGHPGHGYAKFVSYIDTHNLHKKVQIRGYVSEKEKQKLYTSALAFVFPSFYEGFGMPILEAQSFGCPVITSKGIATEEIAAGSAIVVSPDDFQALVRAMDEISHDGKLREKLSLSGKENINRFSWENTAAQTLRIIVGNQ